METYRLLEAIYRARPRTRADLASVVHLDDSALEPTLRELSALGAITVDPDGSLTYADPVAWTAAAVARESATLRAASSASLVRLESFVADLPRLSAHWSVGEATAHAVPIMTRHGEHAAEDLWYETARHTAGSAAAVFPDVRRFLTTDPDRVARFAEAFAMKDSVRAIVPRTVAEDSALLALMRRYAGNGVRFRLLADTPSWFWIDGDLVALPFAWGEAWPTSIIAVRNPALAALAESLFERLWSAATPLDEPDQPWTPLLQLMRQGMTLDAASRTLGMNPRTGRRRVSAGMAHYGVSTLFGLGVAWAADAVEPPA
ncbi:hypothetical protein [Microbacterium sp. CJ88]|uniref:hypothetical protein n=1 Tax=Microbacterium sp. CJ88 TaxID=3445672 RepID=UPI003F65F3AA